MREVRSAADPLDAEANGRPPQRRGVWLPVLIGAAAMLVLVLIVAPLALCLVGVVAGFLN
jgi:hypothetical protein